MRPKRAFTLIELLIVVSIIGILVTLVAVTIQPIQRKSRDARRKSDLNLYLTALDLFKTDFKLYPNHTFYLGKNTTDAGAAVSNFDLGADIAACQGLSGAGNPSNFAVTTDFGKSEVNYDEAVLKPGFAATNHFLVCLKYIDRLVTDSVYGASKDNYHYRVSYDYIDVLVAARLENQNDQEAKTLFTDKAPKRYYLGTGATVRHLDDDSDAYESGGSIANFFSAFERREIPNGMYLYQCNGKLADQDIKRDDRSFTANEPLVFQGGVWKANPNCRNALTSLDDVEAW